jgi:hypothetical protein
MTSRKKDGKFCFYCYLHIIFVIREQSLEMGNAKEGKICPYKCIKQNLGHWTRQTLRD